MKSRLCNGPKPAWRRDRKEADNVDERTALAADRVAGYRVTGWHDSLGDGQDGVLTVTKSKIGHCGPCGKSK